MNACQVQYWPIFLLADYQHVGCAGLHPDRPDEQIYELGFRLTHEQLYSPTGLQHPSYLLSRASWSNGSRLT